MDHQNKTSFSCIGEGLTVNHSPQYMVISVFHKAGTVIYLMNYKDQVSLSCSLHALGADSLFLRLLQIKRITGLNPSWHNSKESAREAQQLFHSVGRRDDLGWDESNLGAFEDPPESFFIMGLYPQRTVTFGEFSHFFSCVATFTSENYRHRPYPAALTHSSTAVPAMAVSLHPQCKFKLT